MIIPDKSNNKRRLSKSYNLIKPIKAKNQKLVEEKKEQEGEIDNKSENNQAQKRRKTQIYTDTRREYSSIFSCIDWENDNDQDEKDSKNEDDQVHQKKQNNTPDKLKENKNQLMISKNGRRGTLVPNHTNLLGLMGLQNMNNNNDQLSANNHRLTQISENPS